jgi:hypothetical protein
MAEEQKTKSTKSNLAKFFLVAFLAFLIGLGSFLAVPIAYSKKILPKVTVAGINLGGQDRNRAKTILEYESQNFNKMRAHLRFEHKIFAPSLAQLGISVDIDETINRALAQGRSGNIFNRLKNHFASLSKNTEVLYAIKVDEKKYNQYFRNLAKYVKKPPINASLKIVNSNVNFTPGKFGMTLDPENTKTEIIASLTRGEIKTFQLTTIEDEPYIQKAETENARKMAEEWMKAKIVLNVHYDPKAEQIRKDQSYTASSVDIGKWIIFKEGYSELEAQLSLSAISDWLTTIDSQATIPAINNKINITNGKRELLSKGKEGQELDIKDLDVKIAVAVKSGGQTFKIKTKILAPQDEIFGGVIPGRFKGKYIEVVLSQQKMYVFIGKKLINIYMISSGKSDMRTPVGSFKILYKTTWAKCKESDEYNTCYMPYSMFFTNEGHAIHELPIIDGWREGNWHLGIPVSHGCIRLGIGPAAEMYNWTPVGTPVIIHS